MKSIDTNPKNLTTLFKQRIRPIKYQVPLFVLSILCIAAVLYLIQILFEPAYTTNGEFRQFADTVIIFNLTTPVSPSIWLSSFVHQVGDNYTHLWGNIVAFIGYSIIVALIWVLRSVLNIPPPAKYFRYTYLAIFLLVPICVSISTLFGTQDTIFLPETLRGFSGIVYAIVGLAIAQILFFVQKFSQKNTLIIHALFLVLGIIIGVISQYLEIQLSVFSGNPIAHFGGYSAGFLVSYFMEWCLTENQSVEVESQNKIPHT